MTSNFGNRGATFLLDFLKLLHCLVDKILFSAPKNKGSGNARLSQTYFLFIASIQCILLIIELDSGDLYIYIYIYLDLKVEFIVTGNDMLEAMQIVKLST